jgi:general secretion pathway protein H
MMPIFQTGIYKKRCKIQDAGFKLKKLENFKACNLQLATCNSRRAGFTLIELIVVILIISLAVALIMPSFWGTDKTVLKTEARHISSALRYIYGEAAGKKQTYLFNINLDDKSWGFKGEKESRNFKMQGDIEIKDVVIPSHGEISRGEVIIEFGPMGPAEPVTLHLKKGESEYTIIFNQLNGRAKILEGYKL